MESRAPAWTVRLALLAGAVVAPGVVFAIRSGQTGNAKLAIDSLGWGVLATVVLMVLFALTFRTTPTGRLGYFGLGTVVVILAWLAMTTLPIFGPH